MPKPDFHTVELNKTEWEVPKRYTMLSPVGSGAYGQVWWVAPLPYLTVLTLLSRPFVFTLNYCVVSPSPLHLICACLRLCNIVIPLKIFSVTFLGQMKLLWD